MTTDKTGAPTSVGAAADKFTIAVDGQQVGLTAFVDQRFLRDAVHSG